LPSGAVVTVATETKWRSMTTADFASYDLIIISENQTDITGDPWQAAFDTRTTWIPAITGNVLVNAMTPVRKAPTYPGAVTFLNAAMSYVSSGPGTALYVASDTGLRNYDYLGGLGTGAWTSTLHEGGNIIILDAAHPSMAGSSVASFYNWEPTYDTPMSSFPSDFKAVAEESDFGPDAAVVVVRDVACP
jgi:hypothetical protein